MSQYHTINAGETERFFTVVARADGSPVVAGTVNYYLKAKSGANDGKWYRNSDSTWQVAETANALTHDADGHWEIDLTASPFADGIRYLEYVKESGNLHVPDARHLIGRSVDAPQTGDSYAVVNSATHGNAALKTLVDAVPTRSNMGMVSGTVATDGTNSATSFKTDLTETQTDYYGDSTGGAVLVFQTGSNNAGQARRVTAYNGSTKFITVESGFDAVPTDADAFLILGRIEAA